MSDLLITWVGTIKQFISKKRRDLILREGSRGRARERGRGRRERREVKVKAFTFSHGDVELLSNE